MSIDYGVVGYIAGTFTVLSLLPQLITIIKHRSAKDVSFLSYYMYISVQALWIFYGYGINSLQIIISNSLCTIICITILAFGYYYRQQSKSDETQCNLPV